MVLRVDPLGQGHHVQAVPQLDDGPRHPGRLGIAGEPADEAGVDLQDVHRKFLQPADRRGRRSEVVDGQPQAVLPEVLQDATGPLRVGGGGGLRDLDDHRLRVDPRRLQMGRRP